MAQENKAVITVRGDFGNPSGSGLSKITLADIWPGEDVSLGVKGPDMTAFHAAIALAQITATNKGDNSVTTKLPVSPAKPGASVNIDRILVVDWKLATSSKTRQTTVPGIATTSTALELIDGGERLNDAGKAAMGTALEGAYGLAPGDIAVLRGKVLQKS